MGEVRRTENDISRPRVFWREELALGRLEKQMLGAVGK